MLISWKQLCGSWVLSRTGEPLGRVRDVVVNPETGEIPALWVRAAAEEKLLSIGEIQRWTRGEIFVESIVDLISPEEFPRLSRVLENEVRIINAPVFERSKNTTKIGVCKNFIFDTLSPKIVSLEALSGRFFWKTSHVIHRRQILEMKEDGIFVSAPVIKEEIESTATADLLNNPLPEPEASQTFRG